MQADLKTFVAMGVYGASVVTAITAQNGSGVHETLSLPPESVAAQLRAVLADGLCDAGKVGMLGNAPTVRAVADELRRVAPFPLVVDPVVQSSSGARLLDDGGVQALLEELLPRTTLLTPNLDELAVLTRRDREALEAPRERIAAAEQLIGAGASAVLVKGGHAATSGGDDARVLDLLHDGARTHRLENPRIDTRHTHGTGCVLSAAIAAGLALGLPLLAAVERGRAHLQAALRLAVPIGPGVSPVNHALARWGGAR
ncbi:MAG: bifunctional hydroxymethylpyrimidine kinase/phosphomethylpyrimidine kinase [Acidobacteria bacterium]|nr:MAG: bifunctional hydroxymethylpyrimidine kinase/phosphomethylpyrimidine kinase [Acidobacteriota bacterium]REK04427.1 MAG: bifunctional hydroxymethylpyrimidine kinase/phosphomethylpyrimidine kinase [Acidobacteriota bacterium]